MHQNADLYFNQPINKAIFIYTNSPLPPGSKSLLNLGLKFCLKSPKPSNIVMSSIARFKHDVRTKHWLLFQPERENDDFNPKLYIKNPHWDPPTASEAIEEALNKFEERMLRLHDQHQSRNNKKNITRLQNNALRELVDHNIFIVVEADKNMGVTIWLRDQFIKQVLQEHLNNEDYYENITANIQEWKYIVENRFRTFVDRHGWALPDSVQTFLYRSEETYGFDRIAPFRATAKVHKNPVKLRPVIAKCGTTTEAISKWLDVELQKIAKHMSWCIKDSDSFRQEVTNLVLPPNARITSLDAVAMYNNIDIAHAQQVMGHWIDRYPGEDLARKDTILSAIDLIMRFNIFNFGDSYFLQKIGTAMGTSCAVQFANLYFGWHEQESILPEFQERLGRLFYHARFVDDVFLIWIGGADAEWNRLTSSFNNFGILKWTSLELGTSVDFLDLTLTIKGNRIVTKTFQKKDNPYLYIPPHSAHPANTINGTIYGLLRTYYHQNTYDSDFVKIARQLFIRHVYQGWDQTILKKIFAAAFQKLKHQLANPAPPPPPDDDETKKVDRSQLFFHMQYHPNDIPRKTVRQIYDEECSEVFEDVIDIQRFTVAYSKPTTIGGVIAKSQLYEVENKEVSKYIAGEVP